MNDAPSENQIVADEQRAEWISPEVTRMRAGEAENNNVVTFDGIAGFS